MFFGQSARVHDYEGASAASFDMMPQTSIEDLVQGQGAATMLTNYDETALCSTAFRFGSDSSFKDCGSFLIQFILSLPFSSASLPYLHLPVLLKLNE